MKKIKNELQDIITGNGQEGGESLIKTVQKFLTGNEATGKGVESQKQLKNKEEELLLIFLRKSK